MRVSVETGRLSAADVRSMFDRIAPVYDVMNHAMTLGARVEEAGFASVAHRRLGGGIVALLAARAA